VIVAIRMERRVRVHAAAAASDLYGHCFAELNRGTVVLVTSGHNTGSERPVLQNIGCVEGSEVT